jgi:hypothetical protein
MSAYLEGKLTVVGAPRAATGVGGSDPASALRFGQAWGVSVGCCGESGGGEMRGVVLVPSDRSDVLWLDRDLAMNYTTFGDLEVWPANPVEGTGVFEHLGGTFASPPAAVALGADRLEVFGLGTDYALYHKSYNAQADAMGNHWSAAWENLGGDLTSTPVAVSTAANRVDVFALGPDQGMLQRTRTGTAWSAWKELGGCFTSAPAVLPSGPGTFDIFARGPDFLIYRSTLTAAGISDWAALGGSLLREPIAASAPAAVRVHSEMYVFVVAADWAIWFTRFDGTVWKPWSSLDGTFVSEPVAIALFPQIDQTGTSSRRIDVFGVQAGDHVLLHNWLDLSGFHDQGWHGWVDDSDGTTEALAKGRYACAPGISAPDPAPTPLSAPPDHFQVVVPDLDGTIHVRQFNGTLWTRWDGGPRYRLPSSYLFSLDSVDITAIMSPENDTDIAVATLAVGARVPQSLSDHLGDVDSPSHHELSNNLQFGPDTVEICEPAILSWSIANSSDRSTDYTVASILTKAAEDYLNDAIKSAAVASGPTVLGSIGGAIVAAVLDSALAFAFGGCDGIVAVGAVPYPNGRVLQEGVLQSPGRKLTGSTSYTGKNSKFGCSNSDYTVNWSIQLTG